MGTHNLSFRETYRLLTAHPWRLLHPPALSLPRQPLCSGTRLVPSKTTAPRLTLLSRFTPHVSRFPRAKRERRWRTFSTSCYRGNIHFTVACSGIAWKILPPKFVVPWNTYCGYVELFCMMTFMSPDWRDFTPAAWLRNPHFMTVFPGYWPRRGLLAGVPTESETLHHRASHPVTRLLPLAANPHSMPDRGTRART